MRRQTSGEAAAAGPVSHHQAPGLPRTAAQFLDKVKLVTTGNNDTVGFWTTCQATTVTVFIFYFLFMSFGQQDSDLGRAGLDHFGLFTQTPSGEEGHETDCFVHEIIQNSHMI